MALSWCSFCCVLLAETCHKASLDSRVGEEGIVMGGDTKSLCEGVWIQKGKCYSHSWWRISHSKWPQVECPISMFLRYLWGIPLCVMEHPRKCATSTLHHSHHLCQWICMCQVEMRNKLLLLLPVPCPLISFFFPFSSLPLPALHFLLVWEHPPFVSWRGLCQIFSYLVPDHFALSFNVHFN